MKKFSSSNKSYVVILPLKYLIVYKKTRNIKLAFVIFADISYRYENRRNNMYNQHG
jgi:hypothetical protein